MIRNTDLVYQECHQKLEPLGHLESLQESEIERLTILQGVGSSEVKGVLPRKREVRPVGIEPTTLDLGNTQHKTAKTLLIKHFAIYETASLHKAYTRIFKLNKSSKQLIKRKTQEESQKPRGN